MLEDKIRTLCLLYDTGLEERLLIPDILISDFTDSFRNKSRFVFSVGKDLRGVDTSMVIRFRIDGGHSSDEQPLPISNDYERAMTRKPLLSEDVKVNIVTPKPILAKTNITKQDVSVEGNGKYLFELDCKCGNHKYVRLDVRGYRMDCNKCKEPLYVDLAIGLAPTLNGEMGYLMTNKYFVDQKGYTWRD